MFAVEHTEHLGTREHDDALVCGCFGGCQDVIASGEVHSRDFRALAGVVVREGGAVDRYVGSTGGSAKSGGVRDVMPVSNVETSNLPAIPLEGAAQPAADETAIPGDKHAGGAGSADDEPPRSDGPFSPPGPLRRDASNRDIPDPLKLPQRMTERTGKRGTGGVVGLEPGGQSRERRLSMSWLFYAAIAGVGILAAMVMLSNRNGPRGSTPHRPQAA